MVIRTVAKIDLDTMASKALYPPKLDSEERVALLAGIVQLVQAALQSAGEDIKQGVSHFMKSDKGVVGYMHINGHLLICEADNEKESEIVFDLVLGRPDANDEELATALEKALRSRGKELSSLWG